MASQTKFKKKYKNNNWKYQIQKASYSLLFVKCFYHGEIIDLPENRVQFRANPIRVNLDKNEIAFMHSLEMFTIMQMNMALFVFTFCCLCKKKVC